MGFNLLNWAIGYGLKKVADPIFGNRGQSIELALQKQVSDWAHRLPKNKYVAPEALFSNFRQNIKLDKTSKIFSLRQAIKNKSVPTNTQWHDAILEQWQLKRKELGHCAQSFFLLEESEVSDDIADLANNLYSVIAAETTLFRNQSLGYLRDIRLNQDILIEMLEKLSPKPVEKHKAKSRKSGVCDVASTDNFTGFFGKGNKPTALTRRIIKRCEELALEMEKLYVASVPLAIKYRTGHAIEIKPSTSKGFQIQSALMSSEETIAVNSMVIHSIRHFIFFNPERKAKFIKYALFHELGHCFLHWPLSRARQGRIVFGNTSENVYLIKYNRNEEIEADVFSAYFLAYYESGGGQRYKPRKPVRPDNHGVLEQLKYLNKSGSLYSGAFV